MKTKRLPSAALLFAACLSLNGCIVAGYTSSGGWFLWPGGLGLVVIVVIALLLMRRR